MKGRKFVVVRFYQLHEMGTDHIRILAVHRALQVRVDHALSRNLRFYIVVNQLGIVLGSHACQGFPFGLGNTKPLKGILDIFRHIGPFGTHFRIRTDISHDLIHIQVVDGRSPVWNLHGIIDLQGLQAEKLHPGRIIFFF